MYVLKKETKRRAHHQGKGGGSPIKISFSTLEEELFEFLTPEAAGLENIPHGGINLDKENSQEIYCDNNSEQVQNLETENVPLHKKLRTSNMPLNNMNGMRYL